MYPHERSLVSSYKNRPFALLGVNTDVDRGQLRVAMAKEGITWRSWFDGGTDGPITSAWQVDGFPAIYLIDHRGTIRHIHLRGEELDKAIEKLVRDAEKEPVS